MNGPLPILPPGPLHQCQAAVLARRRLTQARTFQPLPRWRYCAWSGFQEDRAPWTLHVAQFPGLRLCERHWRRADLHGVVRLLPELRAWSLPDGVRACPPADRREA